MRCRALAGPKKANSPPIGVGSPERINDPSVGGGESDVINSVNPAPTSPGSNADGAMLSPLLGGRKARRLGWTAAGTTGTVKGGKRGDVRRLLYTPSIALVF